MVKKLSCRIMDEKTYNAEICNLCGSSRYRKVRHFPEWNLGRDPVKNVTIVRCLDCGVRRRMPGITDDYEKEYHSSYVAQNSAIHPHQLSHFADLMTARLRQFSQTDLTFLDVGCSTGRALRLARTLGFDAIGLDYSQWACEYCTSLGFEARCGSLIGQWKQGEQFDVIHCSHTIEHVTDPVAYLGEMFRLLKSGGHLMLALPNYASIQRLVLGARWPVWCLDSHLWQFTKQQMEHLLRARGFTIVSSRTLHGYTPNSRLKKVLLDLSATLGFGDGMNIVASRQ
jgi:2-polyprenyl-3-methyl-5-hydroxy-6-metoxy-1,4-benzoquinol methylase